MSFFTRTHSALDGILAWALTSSADPSAVSLTVRGLLISAIPTILYLSGIAHLNLDNATLNAIVANVVTVVQDLLALVGAAMTLYGAARKVYLSVFSVAPLA